MIPVRVMSPYAHVLACGGFAGHVHSAFASSLNIDIAGRLIHLGGDDSSLSCVGMHVPAARIRSLASAARVGNVAVARNGVLRLYFPNGVEVLDLRHAMTAPCTVAPCVDREGALWGVARLSGLAFARHCGLAFDSAGRMLVSALIDPSSPRADTDRAIGFLIGRGRGLTPSGDDMLLGFATALRAAGIEEDFGNRLVAAACRRTTDVSLAYFDAFAHGWSNPIYGQLACSIADRDVAGFERCVRAIGGIGHTSGWDGLFGLRLGFARACADASTLAARPLCA